MYSFCVVAAFFVVFFLLICVIVFFFFFYNLWPSLTYLCILVLLFRLVSPFLFLIFRYVNALIASILPLTAFLFLPLALPATTINIGQHVAFFYPVHTSQNMSCWPIWGSFCIAFVSHRDHTPPLHPYASIITHLHPSTPIFGKTHKASCPGKFPRP